MRRSESADNRRLSRIESDLQQVQQTVDANIKRIAALQAQLDHLAAKIRPA